MNYREAMEKCDAYIESRLSEPITARALADAAGYSLYHFCHVFRAFHGASVGAYIRAARLRRAAGELLAGKSVLDAALDCGFDTHAGFTKAFTREFGMSPSSYRQKQTDGKTEKIKEGERSMKTELRKLDAFKAFGYSVAPKDGDKIDIINSGAYWSEIDFKAMPKYPEGANDMGEVAAWIHPSEVSGELSYFFGYKTADKTVPDGFTELDIPAAEYILFNVEHGGSYKELTDAVKKAWVYIFTEWFDSSEYKFDETKMCFEFYLGSTADIYVPVKAK